MIEIHLFEIPVYSYSEIECNKKRKKRVDKCLKWFYELNSNTPREDAPESYNNFENNIKDKYAIPWNYNEIVGYIRIYRLGNQIRGETWFISAKRIQYRMKNKIFRNIGKTFEISCYQDNSSLNIFNMIRDALLEASKDPVFQKRYIDLSSFINCGQFIDWKSIIESKKETG